MSKLKRQDLEFELRAKAFDEAMERTWTKISAYRNQRKALDALFDRIEKMDGDRVTKS